jgi:hypothetical protein
LADLRSRLEQAALARAAGEARVRHGDFRAILAAHTSRSIRQLTVAVGFDSVLTRSSPPIAHEPASAAQVMVRQIVSACYPIPPAAKTGMLPGHIAASNLTFPARKGAAIANPTGGNPA